MPDILLTTLNARYWHSSFGLRYLMANMGDLSERTLLLEFGIGDRPVDLLDKILNHQPKIVTFGVYIWNIDQVTQLVFDLKSVRPDLIVILGGPEVSYEYEGQPIVEAADFLVTGEGDLALPALCQQILQATPDEIKQLPKVVVSGVPDLKDIQLPYHLYTDEDIAHRIIYVEVSRGCPFTCEFCLSALEIPVRLFDVDQFLNAMQTLLDRGVRQFKFVDRTFNLNMRVSTRILNFFLDRITPDLFLHFEMIPDRLPEALRDIIAKFPDGALQFEIGVQTFNDLAGEYISRKQNNDKLADNFRFLRQQTGVHIHADLIIGLPGEDVESFGKGFDRLLDLQPQEIQVGILKSLKGTPITRHDIEWEMVYSKYAPFEILQNRLIDFATMHRLRRFSRFWDLFANSGNFKSSLPLLWLPPQSAFQEFLKFCDWIYGVEQRTHGISLPKLSERLFEYLTTITIDASTESANNSTAGLPNELNVQVIAESIWRDYVGGGRRDKPHFLRPFELPAVHEIQDQLKSQQLPSRQARHL